MFDVIVKDFKNWAGKPYREDGNILDWVLFVGILTCGTILWTRVIKRLID